MTALARIARGFIARGAPHRLARELAADCEANDRLPTMRQRLVGARRILARLRAARGRR